MTPDQKRAIAYVLTGISFVGAIVGWRYHANVWGGEQ